MDRPRVDLATIALDCRDANALADFYRRLLGWEITYREGDWVLMRNPDGGTGLSFQSEAWYEPSVWPEQEATQRRCRTSTCGWTTFPELSNTRSQLVRPSPRPNRRTTSVCYSTRPDITSACFSTDATARGDVPERRFG